MTDPVDRAKLARAIETELERAGSPERAASEKRYLKSDMDFLGAALADIRRVARQAAKGLDRERAVSWSRSSGASRPSNVAWPRRSSSTFTPTICDPRTSR